MRPDVARAQRIRDLTNMALRGATLEQITFRARQMASPAVAKQYIEQVLRNIQAAKNKTK